MDSEEEARKLAAWKQMLAEEEEEDSDEDIPLAVRIHGSTATSTATVSSARGKPPMGGATANAAPKNFEWGGFQQVRELEETNASLLMQLEKKDAEMKRLRSQGLGGADGEPVPSGLKDQRLVELARKNRALTVQLESERNKSSRQARDIASLSRELQAMTASMNKQLALDSAETDESKGSKSSREGEAALKDANAKVAAMNARLTDQRAQNAALKAEMSKLQRALQREIGDDVSVQTATDEGSSWRGRAQKISLLKARVKELKRDLAAANARGSRDLPGLSVLDDISECGSEATNATQMTFRAKKEFDDMHRAEVEAIEARRSKDTTTLESEMEQKRKELASMKKKADAVSSRMRILETDNQGLRDKIKVLLQKASTDDKLIGALRSELEQKNKLLGKAANAKKSAASEEVSQHVHEQERQIERQEKIILSLRNELHASLRRNESMEQAKQIATDGQLAQVQAQQQQQRLRLVEVELEKQRELSELHQRQAGDAERQLLEMNGALRSERDKSHALERKLESAARPVVGKENRAASGRRSTTPGSDAALNALQGKLREKQDELQQMQAGFAHKLQMKEQEVEMYRQMAEQTRSAYDEACVSMHQQMKAIQNGVF